MRPRFCFPILTASLVTLFAGAAAVVAQGAGNRKAELRTADQFLQEQLGSRDLMVKDRIELLRRFIDRFDDDCPKDRLVLRARCQLGGLYLQQLDGARAGIEFSSVRALAAVNAHDLHGRASYGLAQSQELQEDVKGAKKTLAEIVATMPGTRYARFAEIAQNRLNRRPPAIGHKLPRLRPGVDVFGRRIARNELDGGPALLVFWSPDHEGSMRALRRLDRAWRRGGMEPSRLVAYALHGDQDELRRMATDESWRFRIVQAADGFLHPDLLTLQVTGVPTWWVVGVDGRLLARDLAPSRLEDLLLKSRPR